MQCRSAMASSFADVTDSSCWTNWYTFVDLAVSLVYEMSLFMFILMAAISVLFSFEQCDVDLCRFQFGDVHNYYTIQYRLYTQHCVVWSCQYKTTTATFAVYI